MECPFCERPAALVAENAFAIAFPDAFPLTRGHTLVVPRRHVGDIAELSEQERTALWELVEPVRQALGLAYQPDGFNLGMNVGAAAGQTVAHVHLHVIPRYRGDMADPRGGVRLLFPERARYWERG
ncbi:MAG: HIT family protein [Candidatus Rokubacteria bacterium]|nr:HIT family protein [Candidatus Rokubacteria bacterium]